MIRIVSTRRLDPNLVARAANLGLFIYDRDFLTITPKPLQTFKKELMMHQGPFVFSSVHAVHAVEKAIKYLQNKEAFAIEGVTSQAAEAFGFTLLGSQKNTLELADTILSHKVTSVLHCTTQHRRNEIEEKLNKNPITYKAIEVYNKIQNPYRVDKVEGVMFFSPSQIDSYLQLNILEPHTPAFCIGHTTAGYLEQKGHKNIQVAYKPSENRLFSLLLKYFNLYNNE